MKIKSESLSSLNKKGIYSIMSPSGKRYIGSTKKSFLSRMKTHIAKLKSGSHQNEHLVNAWNKYGAEEFEFTVLEIIENNELTESQEKYWISHYNAADRLYGYNINPNPCKSPSINQVVKEKIRKTLKRKYKSGEIQLNNGNFKKGVIVWNKGKKYKSTDHLKVPKTMTEKFKEKYRKDSERIRSKLYPVEVYKNNVLIGVWKNAVELQEYSLTPENTIPVESKFKTAMRRGKPFKYIASNHVNHACKNNTQYKGLTFKFRVPGPSTE